MGKEIERLALLRNHEIVLKVNKTNAENISSEKLKLADVVIEFSNPAAAFSNISKCIEANVNVVCGTTGWNTQLEEARKICLQQNSGFFYASNFSLGVNLFFEINKKVAQLLNSSGDYDVEINETHHTQKLDAPSGTAITIAEGIIENFDKIKSWKSTFNKNSIVSETEIPIHSFREDNITGTHSVTYSSKSDKIQIQHEALTREAFAMGAILAAEWMIGKKGNFGMNDLLNIK